MSVWFRFMDWPLRAKMAALLVVASLLPLGIETLLNIREARARLLANTAALLAARGDQLLGQLDTFHRGHQRSLDGVAHLPRVLEFYQAGPENRDRLKAILEVWPASDPNIRGVALLDAAGTVQLATEDSLTGLNLSSRSHVREALRGVAVISDVHLAEAAVGDAPTIAYLAPVFGPERKLLGVAAFWVRATALWEVMTASNELAGPQSFAVLFDRQGIRIGHTFSEDFIFHPGGPLDAATVEALVAERRFGEKTRALLEDVLAFPEQFDRARAEAPDRGLFRGFGPVNQKWNYGVARRFETVPWTVFYMIPEQALHAQIEQMTRQKTLFAAVIMLAALLAATLFAAAILKPIASLETATQALAAGDLAARVGAGHADELGRLGAHFNSMAAQIEAQAAALQKGREELERRVQERTADWQGQRAELQLILDSVPALIFYKDSEHRLVRVNRELAQMMGQTREELEGCTNTDLGSPDAERYHRDEDEVMATGQPKRQIIEPLETPGGVRWLLTDKIPRRDETGKIVGIIGFSVDITERKRTEGRFRRLVDSNAQGVIFWNSKGEISGANEAFLRIVGYTREELEAGRVGWAAMTPPEYAHLDRRALEEMAAGGICTPFEKEYLRKDGSRVPILLGAAIFEDSPDEGVCFLLDITERKRTEQALRESEEHFRFLNDLGEATRTLADPAQIMAVTARMLGGHLRASRCAYADVEREGEQFTILHDYTDGCASTVGQYQLSLFGPRAAATLHRGETLIIRHVEAELLPGEGSEMFQAIGIQAIICCPLVKEGGLRAMMAVHQTAPRDWQPGEIAIVQDVVERCWATIERRTAEEKIRQLNAELEQRVTERTAQLEAANKELEAFSYSVSHDLRAPLRAVDGFSRAVEEDYGAQLPPEGQRYLQTIRNGAQRMGLLIDDLLTFSRLSRVPLHKRTVDTARLVRDVLDDLASQREGRQIELRIGDLPACSGDAALLKQVWINLLSNAFKYTLKRAAVVVEIGCTSEPGGHAYFVRDNGTGFDMRYADKLFGVFQRLHRADEFEGTGVGLAIVQRVIHRHGGRVWAEAAEDRGATFYFTLEEMTKP